jgi:hypothetical protein
MIDVVFLLLIFFLIATKFAQPDRVFKTWLPRDQGGPGTPDLADLLSTRLTLRMEGGVCTCDFEDPSAPAGVRRFPAVSCLDFQTRQEEIVPDWDAVRSHLRERKRRYDRHGTGVAGMPVILDFTQDVPWKYVVRLIDIAAGLKLTNLHVAAPELAYNGAG